MFHFVDILTLLTSKFFFPTFWKKNLRFFKIPKTFVNKNAIKRKNSGVRGQFLSKIGVVTIWSQFESHFGTFFSWESEHKWVQIKTNRRNHKGNFRVAWQNPRILPFRWILQLKTLWFWESKGRSIVQWFCFIKIVKKLGQNINLKRDQNLGILVHAWPPWMLITLSPFWRFCQLYWWRHLRGKGAWN